MCQINIKYNSWLALQIKGPPQKNIYTHLYVLTLSTYFKYISAMIYL